MESEKDVEKYVCDVAEGLGGEAFKFKSPQRANMPDRLVDVPGVELFFIECKSEGERASPAQRREHDRFAKRKRAVFVCDTKARVDKVFKFMGAIR